MDSILSLTGISRQRRKILLACCALGAGSYVSYRVYTSSCVTRKRRQLCRFFHCLSSLLEATAQGSDCAGLLWRDLHWFLLSDNDEVPSSLKQLFKVSLSQEFQTSVALLCRSVTEGVVSSFPGQRPESGYGSALFEELSSSKEGVRQIGNAGRDLGYRESRELRQRRWRSSEEADGSQLRDTIDEYYNYRRGKLERSGSASGIYAEEVDRRWKDEGDSGRYSSWKKLRSSSREKGVGSGPRGRGEGRAEGLPERLVGKLFSESGRGFASVVVSSAARSIVLSVLEGMREMGKTDSTRKGENYFTAAGMEETSDKPKASACPSGLSSGMIDFICSSKGKSLVADYIESFVGTAVSIYLDKTRDVNVYEDILSTVRKPEHRELVKELLTSLSTGAVETLVRTSHEVMSVGASGPYEKEPESTTYHDAEQSTPSIYNSTHCTKFDFEDAENGKIPTPDTHDAQGMSVVGLKSIKMAFDQSPETEKMIMTNKDAVDELVLPPSSSRQVTEKTVDLSNKSKDGSLDWIDGVSRTLAVPSNRALILDVAGTMTAEAVRSTIDVVVSKASLSLRGKPKPKEPLPEGKASTSKVLNLINKTGELAQATISKAMVAMSMCVAICLHTVVGPSRQLS